MALLDLGPRHLGWQEGGALVASLRVERRGDGVAITALDCDDVAHARALLDALAGIVDAAWIAGAHDALADCGFDRDGDRWLRRVVAVPARGDAARAVTLAELEAAIRAGWDRETTDVPELWRPDNPALGHCAVSALVVRDYLGGEIVAAGVVLDGRRVGRHAWNRLPSGLAVDLTRDQFRSGESFEEPSLPDVLLADRHPERYELLRARVEAKLGR